MNPVEDMIEVLEQQLELLNVLLADLVGATHRATDSPPEELPNAEPE